MSSNIAFIQEIMLLILYKISAEFTKAEIFQVGASMWGQLGMRTCLPLPGLGGAMSFAVLCVGN